MPVATAPETATALGALIGRNLEPGGLIGNRMSPLMRQVYR